jgi:hypothetical protein
MLQRTVHGLSGGSISWGQWFLDAPDGLKPLSVETAHSELSAELHRRIETWKHGPNTYGAHECGLTNGRHKQLRLDIKLHAGITQQSTTVWFANYCTISIWAPQSGAFGEVASIQRLLLALATIYRAAWGVVASPKLNLQSFEDTLLGVPKVGWLNYFDGSYPRPALLNANAAVYATGDGGWLCRALDDWFSEDDPRHVEAAQSLKEDLTRDGVLRPRVTPPK